MVWVSNLGSEALVSSKITYGFLGTPWRLLGPRRQGKSLPFVIRLIKIFMTFVIEVNHTNVCTTSTEKLIAFINQLAIQFWIAINVIAAVVGEQTRRSKIGSASR